MQKIKKISIEKTRLNHHEFWSWRGLIFRLQLLLQNNVFDLFMGWLDLVSLTDHCCALLKYAFGCCDLIPACSNQIQIHLNELNQPGSLELYKQVYRALQAHPEFFPIGLWIIAERQLCGQQISSWFLLINNFFFFSFEAFKWSTPQSHDVHLTIRFHQLFQF